MYLHLGRISRWFDQTAAAVIVVARLVEWQQGEARTLVRPKGV